MVGIASERLVFSCLISTTTGQLRVATVLVCFFRFSLIMAGTWAGGHLCCIYSKGTYRRFTLFFSYSVYTRGIRSNAPSPLGTGDRDRYPGFGLYLFLLLFLGLSGFGIYTVGRGLCLRYPPFASLAGRDALLSVLRMDDSRPSRIYPTTRLITTPSIFLDLTTERNELMST